MLKVFINAGHGDHDSGAVNKNLKLEERNMTKMIALEVMDKLEKKEIICKSYQEKLHLSEVIHEANKTDCNVFISIHMNAVAPNKAKGLETLYCEGSKQGEKLAKYIQSALAVPFVDPKYTFVNRGVKDDSNRHLGVLRQTKMTSCLVEVGFIDNDTEASFVLNNVSSIAERIVRGIISYALSEDLVPAVPVAQPEPIKTDIQIIPSGKEGTYNLLITGKLVLKENSITTIHNYLKDKYNQYLY